MEHKETCKEFLFSILRSFSNDEVEIAELTFEFAYQKLNNGVDIRKETQSKASNGFGVGNIFPECAMTYIPLLWTIYNIWKEIKKKQKSKHDKENLKSEILEMMMNSGLEEEKSIQYTDQLCRLIAEHQAV